MTRGSCQPMVLLKVSSQMVFPVFVHSDFTNLPLNQLNASEYTLRVWPPPSDSGK